MIVFLEMNGLPGDEMTSSSLLIVLSTYLILGMIFAFLLWIARDNVDLAEFLVLTAMWPLVILIVVQSERLFDPGKIIRLIEYNKQLFLKLYLVSLAILFLLAFIFGWI